jgi:hypothetical protein
MLEYNIEIPPLKAQLGPFPTYHLMLGVAHRFSTILVLLPWPEGTQGDFDFDCLLTPGSES